jgi:hypothetical protein
MWPTTLRSSQTVYATAVKSTNSARAILITATMMKVKIGNVRLSSNASGQWPVNPKLVSLPTDH